MAEHLTTPIAIIGTGFAAAALVLHLHKQGRPLGDIIVIGPGEVGHGQAYGAVSDSFRLNVRADLQRLWADDPAHFERWAAQNIDDPAGASEAGHFYRRHDFAAYVTAQLQALPDYGVLRRVHAHATAVEGGDDGWQVRCATDAVITADHVVVATGNPEPNWPVPDVPRHARLIEVPWDGQWIADVAPDARVVVVGAGLTAMDAVHALHRAGHGGRIDLIAPRGMMPPEQTAWHPTPGFDWPVTSRNAAGFVRAMRTHLGRGSWHDRAWQERFEQLRVGINETWRELPANDRAKLMRRLGWLWSLLRFRAGPHTVASLQALETCGQLHRHTGRLLAITKTGSAWQCRLARPGHATPHQIAADYVVNCTGMGRDPLVETLLASEMIARSGAANAPRVTPDLRLSSVTGNPHKNLFMLGPATGHDLGDVVGSASIARQAAVIAKTLSH